MAAISGSNAVLVAVTTGLLSMAGVVLNSYAGRLAEREKVCLDPKFLNQLVDGDPRLRVTARAALRACGFKEEYIRDIERQIEQNSPESPPVAADSPARKVARTRPAGHRLSAELRDKGLLPILEDAAAFAQTHTVENMEKAWNGYRQALARLSADGKNALGASALLESERAANAGNVDRAVGLLTMAFRPYLSDQQIRKRRFER